MSQVLKTIQIMDKVKVGFIQLNHWFMHSQSVNVGTLVFSHFVCVAGQAIARVASAYL